MKRAPFLTGLTILLGIAAVAANASADDSIITSVTVAASSITATVQVTAVTPIEFTVAYSTSLVNGALQNPSPGFSRNFASQTYDTPISGLLGSLWASTTYYYTLTYYLPDGSNDSISGIRSFITLPVQDTTPPSLTIRQPTSNQLIISPDINGDSGFFGNTSDNISVNHMDLWVDASPHIWVYVYPSGGQWQLDSSMFHLSDGSHTLHVQAFDENNNASTVVSTPFYFNNPILSTIITPTNTSATFQITSGLPASWTVAYTSTTDMGSDGSLFLVNPTLATQEGLSASATITLSPLSPSTAFYYKITGYDAQGHLFQTSVAHFTTGPATTPILTSLNPVAIHAGAGATAVTLGGFNFVSGSVVRWNGSGLATTFVNANQITATIPAADTVSPGTATITVTNPTPNSTSAPMTFSVLPAGGSIITSVTVAASSITAIVQVTAVTPIEFTVAYSTSLVNGALQNPSPGFSRNFASQTYDTPVSGLLGSLWAFTTYYYTLTYYLPDGSNASLPTVYSFLTLPVQDTTPPSLTIRQPTSNQLIISPDVNGDSGFFGNSSDNISVNHMDLWVDASPHIWVYVYPSGGQWQLDSSMFHLSDGSHTLHVQAFDENNNASTVVSTPFYFNNPILSTIITPTNTSATFQITSGLPASWTVAYSTVTETASDGSLFLVDPTLATQDGLSASATITLSPLSPSTAFYYKITGYDAQGRLFQTSVAHFTTGPTTTPILTSLNPVAIHAGTGATAVTFSGFNFVSGSVARWNGSGLATTFVNANQITATIPAADIVSPGTATITVTNPTPNSTSTSLLFSVLPSTSGPSNPAPLLSGLAPSSGMADGPNFVLTLNGGNFISGSVVKWNGTNLATTFVNAGQLTAGVPASDILSAGTAAVTVFNPAPGGGSSSAQTFTIIVASHPIPSLTGLSPTTAIAGSPSFSLTLNGNNFMNGSVVKWNGTNLVTTFVNLTQLTAQVPASDLVSSGTVNIAVFNPAPGGGSSSALPFSVTVVTGTNPIPTLGSLNPSTAIAHAPAFTLTLNGTNFITGSVARWNGLALTTTRVSGTQLTASVPAADIISSGTSSVTVFNPAPGGGTSGALDFTVTASSTGSTNPVPSISSLNPSIATVGGPAFTLTVNGNNFANGALVFWNSAILTTTRVSGTQLTASVPASDIASIGTLTIYTFNPAPGGGYSGAASFTVTPPVGTPNPVPLLTGLFPSIVTVGFPAFTMKVLGSNFVPASIIQWNGTTLPTTFVNSTTLNAAVPASDVASLGSATVLIINPAPGGGTANKGTFTIIPSATVSNLSPTGATIGDPDTTVIIDGSNFINAPVVTWNGTVVPSQFISDTQISATIPAADLTTLQTAQIGVINLDGTLTNTTPFSVVSMPGDPQFIDLPSRLSITNSIQVTAGGNVVGYDWVFTPQTGTPSVAGRPLAAAAVTATISTAGGTLPLRTVLPSLALGDYQVSVHARNFAGKSSVHPAQGNITIVASSDLNSVSVSPNPWHAGKTITSGITFAGVPDNSTIKLFTISAHLVKTLTVSSGSAFWDLTNDSGANVASGVYWYLITGNGQKTHGEVAVIR